MLVDWTPILTFLTGACAKTFASDTASQKIRNDKTRSIIVYLQSDAILITTAIPQQDCMTDGSIICHSERNKESFSRLRFGPMHMSSTQGQHSPLQENCRSPYLIWTSVFTWSI